MFAGADGLEHSLLGNEEAVSVRAAAARSSAARTRPWWKAFVIALLCTGAVLWKNNRSSLSEVLVSAEAVAQEHGRMRMGRSWPGPVSSASTLASSKSRGSVHGNVWFTYLLVGSGCCALLCVCVPSVALGLERLDRWQDLLANALILLAFMSVAFGIVYFQVHGYAFVRQSFLILLEICGWSATAWGTGFDDICKFLFHLIVVSILAVLLLPDYILLVVTWPALGLFHVQLNMGIFFLVAEAGERDIWKIAEKLIGAPIRFCGEDVGLRLLSEFGIFMMVCLSGICICLVLLLGYDTLANSIAGVVGLLAFYLVWTSMYVVAWSSGTSLTYFEIRDHCMRPFLFSLPFAVASSILMRTQDLTMASCPTDSWTTFIVPSEILDSIAPSLEVAKLKGTQLAQSYLDSHFVALLSAFTTMPLWAHAVLGAALGVGGARYMRLDKLVAAAASSLTDGCACFLAFVSDARSNPRWVKQTGSQGSVPASKSHRWSWGARAQ